MKAANAGEMRTPVFFMKVERTTNANGYSAEVETSIFQKDGVPVPAYGKWVNIHGSEVFTAMQLQLRDPVTFTTRHSPQYNQYLIAYNGSEYKAALAAINGGTPSEKALAPIRYEVISVDNVEDKNAWCEIKLQRKVSAR